MCPQEIHDCCECEMVRLLALPTVPREALDAVRAYQQLVNAISGVNVMTLGVRRDTCSSMRRLIHQQEGL